MCISMLLQSARDLHHHIDILTPTAVSVGMNIDMELAYLLLRQGVMRLTDRPFEHRRELPGCMSVDSGRVTCTRQK